MRSELRIISGQNLYTKFSFAPLGLIRPSLTQGLRPGLYSSAASRLNNVLYTRVNHAFYTRIGCKCSCRTRS